MPLTLTNIPRIQRRQGWLNGAVLLEKWISRPASTHPHYGAPDTTTIRMDDFVLTFPRAKAVYDAIVAERIWANAAGRMELYRRLKAKGLLTTAPNPVPFGTLTDPVEAVDKDFINQRFIKNPLLPPLDDLTAALANFNLRVVVAGSVEPSAVPDTWRIAVNQVGIYVWDSFNFEGFQPLGYWDDATDTVSRSPFDSGTWVDNSTFRDWRKTNGKGGDFLVFSDMKIIDLPTPDVFWVTST